jgi:hypothetical protein
MKGSFRPCSSSERRAGWGGRLAKSTSDERTIVVLRYIEAHPARAGIVADWKDYRRSSYGRHGLGLADALLETFPGWEHLGPTEAERRRWRMKVRGAQEGDELTAVRDSLRTGRPPGTPA